MILNLPSMLQNTSAFHIMKNLKKFTLKIIYYINRSRKKGTNKGNHYFTLN